MSRRVSRRKPYPGPVRGTPIGDEIIGPCRGVECAAILHRGDEFIVLVGEILVCGKCRRQGAQVNMEAAK
jgi:hypothetical protein